MYKTGIWQSVPAHQLQSARVRDITSYRLLRDVSEKSDAVETFETIVRHLRLSSGIYRSTYAQRFRDLDPQVNAILERVFRGVTIEVQDWAASDCLASAEWTASLWPIFPSARLIASDILLSLIEVSGHGGKDAYILEPDGAPLQYIRPPFVVSLQKPIPLYYPLNRLVAARARRDLPEVQTVIEKWQTGDRSAASLWTVQEISLVHPLARRLAAGDTRFQIRTHSVFKRLPRACHVLRTMNIFNRGYFDESRLRLGVRCAFDSLIEGGIWVLGRTREEARPPSHSVSIFQRTGRALTLLNRINGGAEIDSVVLGAKF